MIFLDFLKVKKYKSMLQKAPNCTIKNFWGEACSQTPLAHTWLRHASQAPPQKKKLAPLGKSCIRPWTTTEKFI